MIIYKIFRAEEWQYLQNQGQTLGAPIDLQDGYIHFSTAAQAPETARKYFADVAGLVLAAVDADALQKNIKWEVSRGGDKFPHLYAPLRLADVIWHKSLPWENDMHIFPSEMV